MILEIFNLNSIKVIFSSNTLIYTVTQNYLPQLTQTIKIPIKCLRIKILDVIIERITAKNNDIRLLILARILLPCEK